MFKFRSGPQVSVACGARRETAFGGAIPQENGVPFLQVLLPQKTCATDTLEAQFPYCLELFLHRTTAPPGAHNDTLKALWFTFSGTRLLQQQSCCCQLRHIWVAWTKQKYVSAGNRRQMQGIGACPRGHAAVVLEIAGCGRTQLKDKSTPSTGQAAPVHHGHTLRIQTASLNHIPVRHRCAQPRLACPAIANRQRLRSACACPHAGMSRPRRPLSSCWHARTRYRGLPSR